MAGRADRSPYCVEAVAEVLRFDQRRRRRPSRRRRASMHAGLLQARPAAMIVSACGLPIGPWVSSVRSSWRAITASGSLVAATRLFFSSAGLASDQLAGLLVDLEHALDDLRVLLGELLAHVEHAPGVGLGACGRTACAPPSTSAAAIIGSRPAQASTSPRSSASAAVGVLQQHQLHVLLGQLALGQRAHEEDVRVGAAGDGDALALEVGDLLDPAVACLVTSAVHSGRE